MEVEPLAKANEPVRVFFTIIAMPLSLMSLQLTVQEARN
jgi:hypothetical protein